MSSEASDEVVEAEEETQPVNILPTPDMPTQSERDDHNLAKRRTGPGATLASRGELVGIPDEC